MNYLRYLKSRLPFPAMRERCVELGLPTAQGWDKLEKKIDEEFLLLGRKEEIHKQLKTAFEETLSVGSRAIQTYSIDEKDVLALADYFATLKPEKSPYAEVFPIPLSEVELKNVSSEIFLCDVKVQSNSVTLLLCTRRLIEEKEKRSRSQIGDAAINRFGWEDFDEFVLIKRRFVQCYEVIRLDKERKLIELRVENHLGNDVSTALNALKTKANLMLSPQFQNGIQLVNPINLFPAITPLYSDPNEGIVVELGFTTSTGSAKHEKMRTKGADLRKESYHLGGKAAIHGALSPFRIAIRWNADGQHSTEEALLPGSIRQLSNDQPFLGHMELTGISSEAQMRSVFEKVIAHIPNGKVGP